MYITKKTPKFKSKYAYHTNIGTDPRWNLRSHMSRINYYLTSSEVVKLYIITGKIIISSTPLHIIS